MACATLVVPGLLKSYLGIGHGPLHGLNRLEEAKLACQRAIDGRFGDEHFRNTLTELALLHERHPNLNGAEEIVAMFEEEQARLDAASGESASIDQLPTPRAESDRVPGSSAWTCPVASRMGASSHSPSERSTYGRGRSASSVRLFGGHRRPHRT